MRLHIEDEETLAWVSQRLPAAHDSVAPARTFRLRADGDAWTLEESGRANVFRAGRSAVAIRLLERLNELACFTNEEPTVHSGLVADGTGWGIWIPAASGGGKSTLTAQLALSGLLYATDEAVTVSEAGELTGWSKWLCLKRGSHEHVPELAPQPGDPFGTESRWMVPPGALGEIVRAPVLAGVVAFPQHRQGAPTEVHSISKAEAVTEIAQQTFNLRRCGEAGIEALASAVRRSACCVRVTYGDGWDASRVLIELLRVGRATTSRGQSA